MLPRVVFSFEFSRRSAWAAVGQLSEAAACKTAVHVCAHVRPGIDFSWVSNLENSL